jgi:hypothetical protein
MALQNQLTLVRQVASTMTDAANRLVRRTVASLGVWFMPIIVGALTVAALTGSLSFHRGSGPSLDPTGVAIEGEKPFSAVSLYYSQDFVTVVKKARRERRDILANIQALESAWNDACPSMPLTLELISLPGPEPAAGKSFAPKLKSTTVVDAKSFDEVRPMLDDLRNLIVEGDGTGFGRLRCAGYDAQPVEVARNARAGPRSIKAGVNAVGAARVLTGPEDAL